MSLRKLARKGVLVLLVVALALTGCTTAQLQKKYTSFDGCFREQKVIAMAIGGIGGLLVGSAVAGGGRNSTPAAIALAALGVIIGNRIAWQQCLESFPPKSQVTSLGDRNAALAQAGLVTPTVLGPTAPTATTPVIAAPASNSLQIRGIQASPLAFGPDLDIAVNYSFVSADPNKRDVKAKVSRILIFKSPDGATQEIPSSSEDVIQQGLRMDKFSIPTPPQESAKDFTATTAWAFRYVVEVDGMKQEKTVLLSVPELSIVAPAIASSIGNAGESRSQFSTPRAGEPTSAMPASAQGAGKTESIRLIAGTSIYDAVSSAKIVRRLAAVESVVVLQRTTVGNMNWINVRLADGKDGWIRIVKK